MLLAAPAAASAASPAAPEFSRGHHIYDHSGVLSPAEVESLESRAAAVDAAGAVSVVYLQVKQADQAETQHEAADLMDRWDVESSRGARDGFVIFLNLKPGDVLHGQAALFAGERHVNDGTLNQEQLQRIFDQKMKPLLREGRTTEGIAAAIGAGLDAAASNLRHGPPPYTGLEAVQHALAVVARFIYNLLALVLAAAVIGIGLRQRRRHPSYRAQPGPTVVTPPGDLPPALAGALVNRKLGPELHEATILDLARRGALTIEPVQGHGHHAQVRLLDRSAVQNDYEAKLWQTLQARADAAGVISPQETSKLQSSWFDANQALAADLNSRGWYESARGVDYGSLIMAGLGAVAAALLGIALAIAGQELSALIGVVALGAAAVVSFWLAGSIPLTTQAGEEAAAPWRGFRQGIRGAGDNHMTSLDLDRTLPYAVALRVVNRIDKRLRDYEPSWFGAGTAGTVPAFYPYWTSFHSGISPSTAGGAGTGTGASAGGAGAGGGF